jgi:3-hydroxybutyryl-CoA dehydratase
MSETLRTFDDISIGFTHSLKRMITAQDVDSFGHLSGDLNPLHMNEEFASRTPFKQRLVHGLFVGALISTTHTQLTGPGFAYVGQDLKFLGPVFIGDHIHVNVTVVGKKVGKRILILDSVVSNQFGNKVLAGISALKELDFG